MRGTLLWKLQSADLRDHLERGSISSDNGSADPHYACGELCVAMVQIKIVTTEVPKKGFEQTQAETCLAIERASWIFPPIPDTCNPSEYEQLRGIVCGNYFCKYVVDVRADASICAGPLSSGNGKWHAQQISVHAADASEHGRRRQ